MEDGVADLIVLVGELTYCCSVALPVQRPSILKIAVAPVVRDPMDESRRYSRAAGLVMSRQVPPQARVVGLAVGPLGEPVLMVLEPRIVRKCRRRA